MDLQKKKKTEPSYRGKIINLEVTYERIRFIVKTDFFIMKDVNLQFKY